MKRNMFVGIMLSLMVCYPGVTVYADEQLCGTYDSTSVAGGVYKVQNNVWGAGTSQCIRTLNDRGFLVESSEHNNGTSGAPASYPSIWRGCHWSDCTPESGLPIKVSGVANAHLNWQFGTIDSGAWNVTAEAWFKKSAVPGAPDGTELMLWFDSRGSVQPGGVMVGTVTLAGTSWEVWFTNSPGWNFVTYRRLTPAHAVSLDLRPFMDDAIDRGYLSVDWFMMDMEAGFEIWQGGTGLQTDMFTYEVNTATTVNHQPTAKLDAKPAEGNPPLDVGFSAVDSTDIDGDNLTYQWDFGDNSNGVGVAPRHIYKTEGEYVATVTVSDGSLHDSASVRILVRSSDVVSGTGSLLLLIGPILAEPQDS